MSHISIDSLNPPISSEELKRQRVHLTSQITSMRQANRRYLCQVPGLIVLIVVIAFIANAQWQLLPWLVVVAVGAVGIGSLVGVLVAGTLVSTGSLVAGAINEAAVAFASVATVGVIVVGLVSAVDVYVTVIAAVTAVVCISAAYIFSSITTSRSARLKELERSLTLLADADREACLEIKEWLKDDTIRQYRDWVLTETRVFTVGEVDAMRAYWESRPDRQTQAKRDKDIDAACREVYVNDR